jgi:hypothetical protein
MIMAKRAKNQDDEAAIKNWREGDLINTFHLNRIKTYQTPAMQEWLTVDAPELNVGERYLFDISYQNALKSIEGWSEEDLKMKFISPVLLLGHMVDDDKVIGYYDKIISATIEEVRLIVKSDFMFARGVLDVFSTPYFHFQEYKPYKNPSGDSMAQLLQAFLIAQEKNKNGKPIYGVDIVGKQWSFVILEGKDYCISKVYDSVDKEDLLTIIAVLRKFKYILETRLLID